METRMAGDGWLKLHRKARHSAVFADPALWHLWSYLLIEANWAPRQLPDGRTLEPGQLVRGCRRLATDLGISKSEAGRKLERLEVLGCIKRGTQSGTLAGVLTICNWETYQAFEDDPRDASRDTTGTLLGRNGDASRDTTGTKRRKTRTKEGKKGRNTRGVIPPKVEWVREYCHERQNGIGAQEFVDHYTASGWRLKGGQPMKDWQAAIRNWENIRKKDHGRKLFASQQHDPARPVEAI
jgi:hypothetical protein